MINKKLLSFDPAAMRYVWRCVLCQWLSLLCNVAFVWALAGIVGGALGAGLAAGAWPAAFAVCMISIPLRIVCTTRASAMSDKASAGVKRTLRAKIYQKMLALGTNYSETVATSEAVMLASEGVEQIDYEFVECGKVQVWRGRVSTPYRMGETKVNTKIPSPTPGGPEAGRPTACLHTNISPKPKARYKPKNLYRTFILYYWYYMIKVSSVLSFQRRNKTTPAKPIRCAPKWRHPWRCSQPWCSRRPSCQRCAGRHPARRLRRFQWRQPQRPCQSCSAASWRRKGCRQSG